jgi:hypothetical protein
MTLEKKKLSKNLPIFFLNKNNGVGIYMEAAFLEPQVSCLHTA